MPTQSYYELLEQLMEHQKKQMLWRWQIFQAAEILRSSLSSSLGVEYLTYDEGRYRYVELFTPALTPLHLTADGVIEYVQRMPTVNIVIVVALELDSGITFCVCPVQIRVAHKIVEYRISKDGGRWISDVHVMLKWVYQALKENISKIPTSSCTLAHFPHKNTGKLPV
ncbi:hypothetical protein I6X99_004566 [Vibrio parahaemolyticus]|nr:hypothetical protein [Vibrio parahaemolyticus]